VPPPSLFRQRNFSALWWGQLISLLASASPTWRLGLPPSTRITFADPKSSGLLSILAIVMLSVLLFAFTGAWVDRWTCAASCSRPIRCVDAAPILGCT
jgi:hypothetical protein